MRKVIVTSFISLDGYVAGVDGDVMLLCSDGVHGAVSEEKLGQLLASRKPIATVAESVVREALAHGATDNVTAVVIRRE